MTADGTAFGTASRTAFRTRASLHASLSDPVLDTMNFLNEVTMRYPEAISFAPGRPYDGFFDTEDIFVNIRRYLDHLADSGWSPQRPLSRRSRSLPQGCSLTRWMSPMDSHCCPLPGSRCASCRAM